MRSIRGILLLLTLGVLVVGLGLAVVSEQIGIGSFNQTIIVEAGQPIRRVTYCCWNVENDIRRPVEQTADPRYFDCEEARMLEANRFRARIWTTTRSGVLRGDRVSYPKYLVVYVELVDGMRACRVLDLPRGCGQEAVVVQLR